VCACVNVCMCVSVSNSISMSMFVPLSYVGACVVQGRKGGVV